MKKLLYALHPPASMLALSAASTAFTWGSPLVAVSAAATTLFAFDVRGRWRDYHRILNEEDLGPATGALWGYYGQTWCGRTVVKALHPGAKYWYRAKGYRWYHVLPDGALSLNSPFLKPRFWHNLAMGQR